MSDRSILSHTTEPLRVPLTERERLQKGDQLARQVGELVDLRSSNKEEKRRMKQEEDALEEEVLSIRHDVATGTEERPVDCDWVAAWETGQAHLIRLDTGAIVRSRPLEEHERQLPLGGRGRGRRGRTSDAGAEEEH